jgi:transcriptional regulator with XRE-family HTH domain
MRLGPRSARITEAQARSLGGRYAQARVEHRWSQRALAERLGTTQTRICRFELGVPGSFDLELASAMADELGIRPVFGLEGTVAIDRSSPRVPARDRCVGYVARRLRADDWRVETEVEVGAPPWLGWVDVFAYHEAAEVLLIQEIKTELHDAGNEQRRLARYEREAIKAATMRGLRPRAIVTGIALLATGANDQRLMELAPLLREAFPVRARTLALWLRNPTADPPRGRTIAMFDPRSRRRDWLRPTRLDGRRTQAPYRDHADFLRSVRRVRPI